MNDKEQKILETADVLFARFGLKKTTVDDIAKETGIAKGTVYLYFKSKEEIFLAAQRMMIQTALQKIRSNIRPETTAGKQLHKFFQTRYSQTLEWMERRPINAEFFIESQTIPEYRVIHDEYFVAQDQIIRGILEFGVESKEFEIKSMDQSVWAIAITLHGIVVQTTLMGKKDAVTPAKITGLVDMLLNGLIKTKKSK